MTQALRHALAMRLNWQKRMNDPALEPRLSLPSLGPLRRWQSDRLKSSFTEILQDPKMRPAGEFFLADLYADKDFSARDRDEGTFDQPELSLGSGAETAQVSRLYSGALQFRERGEHRECFLTVEIGGGHERRGDGIVEKLRRSSSLADQFVTGHAPLRREDGWRRECRPTRQRGRPAGIQLVQIAADDLERQVVIALHGEHEAQPVQVARREFAIAGFGTSRGDELAFLEESELRRAQVGKLGGEPGEYLPDAEQRSNPRQTCLDGRAGHYLLAWCARSNREA